MKEANKSFKSSDEILKQKGKYVENKTTKNLEKDELKIKRSADGGVSFESPKKQEDVAKKEPVDDKNNRQKVGSSAYFQTFKEVFSSKDELISFFRFVKSLFVKRD